MASGVNARALAVTVISDRPVGQRVALDSAGAIELAAVPFGIAALANAEQAQPDAIVIDAGRSFDAFVQLFRSARTLDRLDHIPVLAWLDPGNADQIAAAINAGVDDCLTADVHSAESVARLRAASRRAAGKAHRHQIRFADLLLDTASLRVWRRGQVVPLTVFQIRLLEFLMVHPGEVFSRRQLLDQVWGKESSDEGAVTACIARIRRALGQGRGDGLIRSVRGAGYALDGAGEAMFLELSHHPHLPVTGRP